MAGAKIFLSGNSILSKEMRLTKEGRNRQLNASFPWDAHQAQLVELICKHNRTNLLGLFQMKK
jgi:hypothetical protein